MSSLSQFFGGGPQVWVSGTTYTIGTVLLSPADNYQQYVRITNGAGTTDPASDATNYRPFGARAIKSIQRGVISMSSASSASATVTAVNPSRAELTLLGVTTTDNTVSQDRWLCRLELTNSTTVSAVKIPAVGTYNVAWQLVEYY